MPDIIVPSGWGSRFEDLVGSKRQTMALAGVVLVAVAIGVVALGGRVPARVAPPATAPAASTVAQPPVTPSPAPQLFVHVSGAVRAPGLYVVPEGGRVADAIELAGGPASKADLDPLNLAEQLVDGAKVHVPVAGETPPPSPARTSTPATVVVDINSADVTQLETIPGIGPTRAAAIVAHREEVGPFRAVDQLIEVQGIGPATLESLRPYVTV